MLNLFFNKRGQTTTEYVLLVVLIAVALIATVRIFGRTIHTAFISAANSISEATGGGTVTDTSYNQQQSVPQTQSQQPTVTQSQPSQPGSVATPSPSQTQTSQPAQTSGNTNTTTPANQQSNTNSTQETADKYRQYWEQGKNAYDKIRGVFGNE